MKVNDIDIRKFNAKQLTVDIQAASFENNTEWAEGAVTPHQYDTEIQYGTLKLEILFRGNERSEIIRTVSEFLALMTKRVQLKLDGYKGTYAGDIISNALKKTKQKNKYILELQFNGYMTDTQVVNTYKSATEAKFTVLGTRKTPCIIEILPQTDLQEFVISGFGDDNITLSYLEKNKVIIINGENGTVTQDGVNKFADCDIWEFPSLTAYKEYDITFSSNKCNVTIKYSPMWL